MFAPLNQFASGLTAGLYGSSGGNRQTGATVVSGPVFSPTGALVPYATYSTVGLSYGSSGQFKTTGTRISPTGAYSTRSIENAANTYYQGGPGQELTSFAPGARQIWEDIAQGYLPDIGPKGVETGTAPGMPIWIPLVGVGVLALLLLRKR